MRTLALSAAFAFAAQAAVAWTLEEGASVVNFVSMKNGEAAEAHSFGALSGEVGADGAARVEIGLASVDTGIEIRDERMREHLFEVDSSPVAVISADIPLSDFEGLEEGDRRRIVLPITVSAHGLEASYEADALVTRIAVDKVSVSSRKPVIVEATDFGYGPGIEKLRDIAGLESIQFAVPVGFDLVFRK